MKNNSSNNNTSVENIHDKLFWDVYTEMLVLRKKHHTSYLYESLCKGLFFKDFQSSLWPVKKYVPAMPVYMKASVRGCFSKDFQSSLRPGKKYAPAMPVLYESLSKPNMTFMVRCGLNRVKTLVCPWQFYVKVSVNSGWLSWFVVGGTGSKSWSAHGSSLQRRRYNGR